MKYNSSESDKLFKPVNLFIPITGTSSALDLLRDKIWVILDKRSGIYVTRKVAFSYLLIGSCDNTCWTVDVGLQLLGDVWTTLSLWCFTSLWIIHTSFTHCENRYSNIGVKQQSDNIIHWFWLLKPTETLSNSNKVIFKLDLSMTLTWPWHGLWHWLQWKVTKLKPGHESLK